MFKIKNGIKKSTSLLMSVVFFISILFTKINVKADDLMGIVRNTNATSLKVGDTFDVKYTITPNPIPAESQINNKTKDVALVIDTSGSMEWDAEGQKSGWQYVWNGYQWEYVYKKSRLDIMKEISKNFINKFNEESSRVNISISEFNYKANNIINFNNVNSNSIDYFNSYIDRLAAKGSTNTGDGLRKAYYSFNNNRNDKYIILMTDGEPEAFSTYNNDYFFDSSNEYNIFWTDNNKPQQNYKPQSLKYANLVAKNLIAASDKNINTFVIGFNSGADYKNKQIADSARGTYLSAQDENTINNMYDKIQKIISANINGSIDFIETISPALEVVNSDNLPYELSNQNNKITGSFNNIYYTLSEDKKWYTAEPIEFTITYRAKSNGSYELGGNEGSYVKFDVLGKSQTKYFNKLSFNNLKMPEVKIEVSDSTGIKYKHEVATDNYSPKIMDLIPYEVKLKGDAYADIKIKGQDLDFFKYQFINSSSNNPIPIDSAWEDIGLNKEVMNNDVIIEKNGYLNWRGYDVNHLETTSSKDKWEDAKLVYKYPNEATDFKLADISRRGYSGNESVNYGKLEDYINSNGIMAKRWISNSVFMDHMDIGNNGKVDYKEASKFWGYIKVPRDGNYVFGTQSDDGSRGQITVDGVTTKFVDMLKVQGTFFGTTHQKYDLKADRYYPIYLEYFNWGGKAEFKMKYSVNGEYSWDDVPKEWFYPSKDITPGEYAEAIFTGSKGIKFPKEPGKYYVAYKTGKGSSVKREGIYGPFTIEAKANLELSRYLDMQPRFGQEFELKYKIAPKEIPINSIYPNVKKGDTINNLYKITMSNFSYQDTLPKGLTPINKNNSNRLVINGQKISGNLDNINGITYVLYNSSGQLFNSTKDDITNAVYKAQPFIYSIWLQADDKNIDTYMLLKEKSILTYRDIDDAMKQANFPDFNLIISGDSSILKQGIFVPNNSLQNYINEGNSDSTGVNQISVPETLPINIAMSVDIQSINPEINLRISGNFKNESVEFKKYEIENGAIKKESLEKLNYNLCDTIIINNNTSGNFKFLKGKKYIIIYNILPNGKKDDKITIDSTIDNQNNFKRLILNIDELPNIE